MNRHVLGKQETLAELCEKKDKEIAELKQQLNEANEKNVFLKAELKQLANFNPDWDRLQASAESLVDHMQLLNEANAYIEKLKNTIVNLGFDGVSILKEREK